jgi:L,D-peptidoglycan transpeptidase YkuD (ErfK/YbiS/YcfS/YnhG family)
MAPTTTAPTTAHTAPPTTADPGSVTGDAPGGVSQLVTVTTPAYGDTVATFDAYQASATGGLQLVYGPWQAYIGANGFAPAGQKTEGDERTPSGTYGFGFFFGDLENPGGFQFPFRQVSTSDYWNDDPTSSYYNQWVDVSTQGAAAAGADPEPMYDEPYYDYGAVIDYNTDPVVPGAGSAIFLHVSTGAPTTGCVTLPVDELLEILRWLDPAQDPVIQMGVG